MDVGMLESDHLLDVLTAPQLYSFEVWVETINLDKTKIKPPEKVENEKNTEPIGILSKSNITVGSANSNADSESNEKDKGPIERGISYILPSGLKPLRVRFDLFGKKVVSITQIEFDKLLKLSLNGDIDLKGFSQDSKTSWPGSTSNTNTNTSSTSKIKKQDANNVSGPKDQIQLTAKNSDRRKLSKTEYIFNLDEVINVIDEEIFYPKDENVMRKGARATFAMEPMKLMQSLQSGEIIITVDRYGGRKTDEGDPQGKGKLILPKQWIETVLKVANEPNLAPKILEIGDNLTIMDSSQTEVGTLEYLLTLTCHAGCVVSPTMPSELGLCVSLGESKSQASVCHTPIINKKINNYQSMMRKSTKDNYEILFQPSCTKSTRPTKY